MIPLEVQEYRRYAFFLAFFALGLYVALVVASFGMLSLFLDIEVIAETDAGPLVGPVMVGAATIALLLVLWAGVGRAGAAMHTVPVSLVLLAAALCYLVYGFAGGLVYGLNSMNATTPDTPAAPGGAASEPVTGFVFLGEQLTSPFAAAVALWAGVVALLYFVLLIWRANGGQRPRWPWEKHPQ
ncbi:DUF6121 family protein [Microterricola pindariensis]|uniref:DUF6121 family protein n=1 Tax=Microterricola pindariensis TaxID=478010 RepID=UPI000CEBC310|nr:DUF6121 family protein [Microterricola pindariensis]